MKKLADTYLFRGFGFDVLLRNVVIKKADGEEYPDINMNELKLVTAKALSRRPIRMTGNQMKFLRTFLQLSFDALSEQIAIPASTLRSWETKGEDVTGLTIEQEKTFRVITINMILERERNRFDKDLLLTKALIEPQPGTAPLDVDAHTDYSFVAGN